MRRAALLLLLAAGVARAAPPAAPVHLAAGSWATSEALAAGAARARLRFVSGPMAELRARLEAELAPAVVGVDGSPATARSLAEGAPASGAFLLWVSPPLPAAGELREQLEARPVRHELRVDLVATPRSGAPGRRWFSLWHLPADLPLLTARVAVGAAGEPPARSRYLGPRSGHPVPGEGWVEPGQHILRAPASAMPADLLQVLRSGPPPPGDPVAWQVVAHGDFSGAVRKPGRRVLRDPGAVRQEWERLHQGVLGAGPPPELADRGQILLALYQGELAEPAVRREVSGVWLAGQDLIVGVRASGQLAAEGLSPYVWVRAECPAGTRVEVRPY